MVLYHIILIISKMFYNVKEEGFHEAIQKHYRDTQIMKLFV